MATLNKLQKIFRSHFDDPSLVISDATTAADIEEWDSLSHVGLMLAIESGFSMRFTSTEIAMLDSVGSLRELIESKKATE